MRGVRKYVLLGVLFPGLAWGADVRLSISGSVEYDDNVTRSENDKQDDAIFRVAPQIRVVEDRDKLNYSVGYQAPYEVGVTSSEVNDLNHLADANLTYRLTPQTELFGRNSFFYVRGLFSQDQALTNPTTGQVGDTRDRILQNDVLLGARHQFTPRLSGTLRASNGVYDTNQFARANVVSVGASASTDYQLTPHHALGGGFSYSRQMFQDTFNRPSSDTNYYNLFGSWEWIFDETTVFNIQAGPAIIDSTQDAAPSSVNRIPIQFGFSTPGGVPTVSVFDYSDPSMCPTLTYRDALGDKQTTPVLFDNAGNTCPVIDSADPAAVAYVTDTGTGGTNAATLIPYVVPPRGVSDTKVTYFASAGVTKRWTPNLVSNVEYVRQDNGASGIDGGAVLDAVTLSNTWRISERWDLGLRADWTLRKSATDGARIFVIPNGVAVPGIGQPVANAFQLVQVDSSDSLNTQRWGTAARLAYRLTKNTVTALQYAYNKQSSDGDTVGEDSDFDNHLVTFTIQYNFEPIGLPW